MLMLIVSSLLLSTSAYIPAIKNQRVTSLYAKNGQSKNNAKNEQIVKDLDLNQMFEVFEAADNIQIPGGAKSAYFDPKLMV